MVGLRGYSVFSIIVCLILLLSFPFVGVVVESQPTWSLRIEVLPGEYYMGEWGRIRVNITNTDCVQSLKIDFQKDFKNTRQDIFMQYIERAEIMKSMKFIDDYFYRVENLHGAGSEIYGDYTLNVLGACKGRKITLTGVGVWFAWTGYARSLMSWKNVQIDLEAFNPISFILNGYDRASSTIIEFDFLFPEDIHPDEVNTPPSIDVRMVFPGWMEYTIESVPLVSNLKLLPYRSFNLTITDFDGLNILPGAKLVLRRLVYYYDVREYVVPQNGRVKIHRLLDDKYQVEVYWNSSEYLQRYPFIYFEQHWAYELASSKVIKTRLFNPKIKTLDLKNSTIDGARVFFDGIESSTINGVTKYMLVPEGNHTVQVYWKKIKVYDGWMWVGYHPTIYPWMTRPAVEHTLILPVGDLVLQAVDSGGNPVGANFTVIGLNPETSIGNIYVRNGLLNLSQVPVGEYMVRAVNISRVFNEVVENQGVYSPGTGTVKYIQLPIHTVEFKIVSMDDKPLPGTDFIFGPIRGETDFEGIVKISGVLKGTYKFNIFWRNILVYDSNIDVSSSMSSKINVNVYDVDIKFTDNRDRRLLCSYSFRGPGNISVESNIPIDGLFIELVPEGYSTLVIKNIEGKLLYNSSLKASDFSKLSQIRLPVDDLIINITWSTGEPLERSEVKIKDLKYGLEYSKFTNASGLAIFDSMVFSNYSIRVNYPDTPIALKVFNQFFDGGIVNVQVKKAWLGVRVVDSDGNPIEKAEVTVFYGLVSLGKAYTDKNGYVFFKTLPEFPSYSIIAKHRGSEQTQTAIPNSTITFTFEKPMFTEELINMIIQLSVMIGVAALAAVIIYKVAKYVKKSIESIPSKP